MSQKTTLTHSVVSATIRRLDFNKPELCERTCPVTCEIQDITIPIVKQQNWALLFVVIAEKFIHERNSHILELYKKPLMKKPSNTKRNFGKSLFPKNENNVPFFMNSRFSGRNCIRLSNGKWIDINFSIPNIVNQIGMLCTFCGVSLDTIKIDYIEKNDTAKIVIKELVKEKSSLQYILINHFANGFRIESPIELSRFRRFASEATSQESPLSDEVLKNEILACGILYDGKIYVVTDETKDKLKEIVNFAFSSGCGMIFYRAFYDKHESWLFRENIVSVEMLKDILQLLYNEFIFAKSYFCKKNNALVQDELLNLFLDSVLLNYNQLSEKLPYIPLDKIKLALVQNVDFIWNSIKTYTHISKFDIMEEEILTIISFAETKCNAVGYLSLSDIPLNDIAERNYELSVSALYNAVFQKCLYNKYECRGKIVTRKGIKLDALEIMKEHCRTLNRCSLDDLFAFEKNLTGDNYRWIPMEAAYAVMVRTEANTYVAESLVDFNVDAIDTALEIFCPNDYLPLRAVTTFAVFAHVEQIWTLFLLESYVRRFSNKFRFKVLSVNSKNCGAIVRKSSNLDYREIMTDAVVRSSVTLEKNKVLEFLFNCGYIGKRRWSGIDELLRQAKILREGGR